MGSSLPALTVHVTPHFERAFRKLSAQVQKLAAEKDAIFHSNPHDPRLKTHRLKGNLKALWSYSVDYSHRILFEFLSRNEVLYHDIGTHDIYH